MRLALLHGYLYFHIILIYESIHVILNELDTAYKLERKPLSNKKNKKSNCNKIISLVSTEKKIAPHFSFIIFGS